MVDLNNVFNWVEKFKGNIIDEIRILDMYVIFGKFVLLKSGGNCVLIVDDVEKFCMDMSNFSIFKLVKNDGILLEIVGFYIVSGKCVLVFLEVLVKVKIVLE